MSMIQVTSATLRRNAEQLRALNRQFKTAVDQLQNQKSSLDSMWEGDAKKVFNDYFTKNKASFEAFSNGIAMYANRLEEAAARYEEAEAKNTQIATTK